VADGHHRKKFLDGHMLWTAGFYSRCRSSPLWGSGSIPASGARLRFTQSTVPTSSLRVSPAFDSLAESFRSCFALGRSLVAANGGHQWALRCCWQRRRGAGRDDRQEPGIRVPLGHSVAARQTNWHRLTSRTCISFNRCRVRGRIRGVLSPPATSASPADRRAAAVRGRRCGSCAPRCSCSPAP